MNDVVAALLIKLPLALLVFLLVAYAGTISQRIAGVLFTFPILNGVAIIASPDPIAVADAIYPLVIFNCGLFAAVISFPRVLPPVGGALPRTAALFLRVIAWSAAWLAGAFLLTLFHTSLPGGAILLAGAAVFAVAFMLTCWTPHIATPDPASRLGAGFVAFWASRTGIARIVFFCLAYAVLVSVSFVALDEKWVGMASALPLPGFFALATLIESGAPVRPIRDTLFLGPALVIPFNWAFSHLLVSVLPPVSWLRYGVLFAMWAVAAAGVVLLVSRIEACLDVRSPDGAKRNPG
jgi:hypothetical protein